VKSINRPLVAAIVTFALVLGFAQAQSTQVERDINIVFAVELDGAVVACPDGYPITRLAACFRVWGDHDFISLRMNHAVRQYYDASWATAWNAQGPLMLRTLRVETLPNLYVFLSIDPQDPYRTIVWFIEQRRFPN
jgi:hypothetical protein